MDAQAHGTAQARGSPVIAPIPAGGLVPGIGRRTAATIILPPGRLLPICCVAVRTVLFATCGSASGPPGPRTVVIVALGLSALPLVFLACCSFASFSSASPVRVAAALVGSGISAGIGAIAAPALAKTLAFRHRLFECGLASPVRVASLLELADGEVVLSLFTTCLAVPNVHHVPLHHGRIPFLSGRDKMAPAALRIRVAAADASYSPNQIFALCQALLYHV